MHIQEPEASVSERPDAPSWRRPWVTLSMIAICIVAFVGYHLDPTQDKLQHYLHWGFVPPMELRSGMIWGVISSNFLHIEVWHIAFNLYWFWILGRQLEVRLGRLAYLGLLLGAGIVSSAGELLGTDITGIGLSGILYGFFGYLLVRGWWDPMYAKVLSKRTIWLMLGWLPVCILLTRLDVLEVGNFAHVSGLIWGSVAGFLPKLRQAWLKWSVPIILLLPLLLWFSYAPWTRSWLSKKAYDLHLGEKPKEALMYYDRILERYPDDEFALVNSAQLRRYLKEMEVYDAITGKQYHEAAQLCRQMLRADSTDSYARTQLQIAVADSMYQAFWHRP